MTTTFQTIFIAAAAAIPTAAVAAWAATIQERGKHEDRIDKRIEVLFQQYESRLEELERQVSALEAALRVEREDRKLAELSAQAAHLRAEEAEAKLAAIKTELSNLTLQRDELAASFTIELAARDRRIAALNARVAELEAEVARLSEPI